MNISPYKAGADEFLLGASSCRPPGDGQENACPDGEPTSYKWYKPHLHHVSSTETNPLAKHQVYCKMKSTDQYPRSPESEPSKHGSYLDWARELHKLLDDQQGLKLFKTFLISEKFSLHSLDFLLAVQGLNMYDHVQLGKAMKVIYKKYIKAGVVTLRTCTKDEISYQMSTRKELVAEIFDPACEELKETVLHNLYLNFLKSDLYVQYVRKMQNGPAMGGEQCESGGSNSKTGSRDMLNIMPTVPEDCELSSDYKSSPCVLSMPKTDFRPSYGGPPEVLRHKNPARYMSKGRPSNSPYAKYSSFLPPSAQDSDRQSVSSDAHTEDTMSMSDFDMGPQRLNKSHGSYERSMRKQSHINCESELQPMIPRTQHIMPQDSCEATENPHLFAAKLIVKLSQLQFDCRKNEERDEKLQDALKRLDTENETDSRSNLKRFERIPPQLLTATIHDKFCSTNESDQSILDQHVSRIWSDSLHQTPTDLTPGQYSPPARTRSPPVPERHKQALPATAPTARHRSWEQHVSSQAQYNFRNSAYTHHRHRKDRDNCSTDSGTVQDYTFSKEASRHHHHHLSTLENTLEQPSGRRAREVGSSGRRSSTKKPTSADSGSSCVDSGVSVCDPDHPAFRDKVSSWLVDAKYSVSHGPDSERDSSTHHKKSSRSVQSNSSGNQSKPSHSKKQSLPYHLEYGVGVGWPSSNSLQPPSMPSAQQQLASGNGGHTQMDVTAQLVEAKKRLEEESRYKQSSGSRNKKMSKRSSSGSLPQSTLPDGLPSLNSSGSSAATSLAGTTSSSEAHTTVCYRFSGEEMPYLTKLPGKQITFKQFKTIINKRGNFRYFFKTYNNEFGSEVVQAEVSDDNDLVPLWEGKIYCKINSVPDP